MKLKNLKMDNFAKFHDFEVEFDGKITNLIGINGSGKTTVGLTAIWACLKGISKNSKDGQLIGERYRFIGDEKDTANIELTLLDEECNAEIKIKNHISKTGNKITFYAPDNYKLGYNWLNNLFSVAFLSTKNFIQHTPKEQAILLGINTNKFDNQIAELKQDYTYINKGIRAAGEIKTVEKAEKVSISELLEEKRKADAFNNQQDEIDSKLYDCQNSINVDRKRMSELREEIKTLEQSIASANNFLIRTESPKQKIDIQPIIEKINNAEETNQNAVIYQQYLEKKEKYDLACKELEQNKKNQQKVIQDRLDYIKSFDFGIDNLSVSEDGGLLLDNRPIQDPHFSKGEREMIVAKLHEKINPELKVRFIDDFELLDEKNQESIIKNLLDAGFQIITAQVGEKAKSKENTILLRECKKIEEINKGSKDV